ncbi:MAG: LamG-like jellyroll fold domain-containing protein, partial [Candidatus Nanohalobium sp.]
SDGTEIRSVKGFKNSSKKFKLQFNFSTANASKSPLLDEIDFKARKDSTITWSKHKSVQNFFNEQYGTYKVDYGARDYGGNVEDTTLEESNFTVRDIVLKADHTKKKNPGENLKITGNATLVKGDGNGGKSKSDFTGKLNVLLNDTIRGKNSVNESILFKSVSTGSSGEVRVNGSLSPANTQVTFYGDYSGTDETLVWNSSTDWDSYQSRTGTSHSLKIDSALSNKSLTLGYPSQDLGGSALESYYAMDDNSAPLDDSMKKRSFEKVGTPEFGKKGILSTEAVKLSGSDGFNATSPFTKKGSFTINAWVKPESIPSSSGHLGTGTGDPYTVLAIKDKLTLQIVKGGNVYAEANVSGQNYSVKTTSGNVKADEWTMISLVYNTGDDSFAVSTGQGGDSASTTITTTPDLTSKKAFIGYRSDIDSNGFKGKIDELRIYSRDAIPFNLRNLAGDKSEQQKIITGKKSFSETVKTGSLVLEADIEKKGQPVRVTVRSNAGGTSDTIQLQDGSKRYQITGSMADAQKYSLKVEMDSNVTNTAKIKQLKLVRRYATENPEIDLDGDTNPEANFTGRILEGEKKTVDLENLSTGINNVNFSSKNGIYDARINYTEKLAENNYDQVDLNSTGDFSTNFTVPKFSGKTVIDYYTTNERGIQGITNTTLTSSLLFNNESVEDLENGDRTVDPKNLFQVNASLNPHKNDIERMWAVIATPGGNSYERNFSKYSQNWRFKENTSEIFDKEGNYTADLHVRDTEGLRELESPMISFNVTNGTISASPVDATVGLNREFTVNGTVRQNLSGQRVNASVNITLPYTGETKIVDTNSSGEYSVTLQSPSQTGNYTVKVNSEDEDNITASNSTKIQIKDTTSISLGVPDVVPATNVGTEEGQNKTFTVNITNTGDTDARNIKVFSINLPTVNGGKWISLNHTFNVSSGEKKQATGEVWIKAGAPFGTYDSMSIVAKFNESDGTTTNSTVGYSIEVKPNKRPLWQNNKSVTRNEGFSGSLLNSSNELELKNTGTSTANGVTWNLSDSRIKSWTKIYKPRQNPGDRLSKSNLGSGEKLNLFNMTVDIPNGTAPGNYSVLLESDSDDPTATNDANLTVEVPNKPTFNLTFKPTKKDVKIPSGEINMSNPIQMGTMATGTTAERLFNITLNNNGNRDLEWTANREQSGERRIYFNKSDVGTAEVGTEVRESDIGLKNQQNYTYKVPDKIMPVYYKVASTASAETYRANVTITCRYPIGDTNLCDYPNFNGKSKFIKRNGKIILPLNGTVEDPKAEFTDLGVKPSTTGVEDPVTVSATVEDNKQTYLTENDPINASIKKNINDTMVIVKKTNLDIKFGGKVDFNFKPTKEFDEGTSDNQEPDYYCVSFTVEDSSGQKTTSKCTDFKVKESASPDISRDSTSITLENVTATSGDSEYITGKVKGGNVKARNLNISFSTDAPSKFSFSNSKLETGDLAPGKNASFNVTMNSVENIDPLK